MKRMAVCFALSMGCGGLASSSGGDSGTDHGGMPLDAGPDMGQPSDGDVDDRLTQETGPSDGGQPDSSCVPACMGTCFGGRCVATLSTTSGGGPLALGGTSVVWLDFMAENVMSVPASGGTVTTLASGQTGFFAIAASPADAYWTWRGSSGSGSNAVRRVPIGGGSSATFVSEPTISPTAITVDSAYVYWTNQGMTTSDGTVARAPLGGILDGGTAAIIASGLSAPSAITVDSSMAYWAAGTAIEGSPLGGGKPMTLASGVTRVGGLANDDVNVYWTAYNTGVVAYAPKSGGGPNTLAAGRDKPTAIVVDSASVYWLDSHALMKVPVGGGSPVTLAPYVGGEGLAVDSVSVYWTTNAGVLKITPK
jgi:hypothetical protein